MITKYIKGDITETELRHIAHGVNCQNVMGGGVAKALFEKWPEIKTKYHEYCNWAIKDQIEMLGTVASVILKDKNIYNLFTQEYYGYDKKRYVSYSAIVNCFQRLVSNKHRFDGPIAIPKIGCGLAGGDWKFVEQLINDTVGDDLEIWVYDNTPEPKYSKRNGDIA